MIATEATPIFDTLMGEQDVEMMPLPAPESHNEFLVRHGLPEFLLDVEQALVEAAAERDLDTHLDHLPDPLT